MIILIINMYKDQVFHRRFKKRFIYGLEGCKIIFKKWNDISGIKNTLKNKKIAGIIITGSDYFVGDKVYSHIDESILSSNIPILAICYGFQYLIHKFGRHSFIKSSKCGYMIYNNSFRITEPFYIPKNKYYFIHADYIAKVPKNFKIIKKINNKIMIAYNYKRNILGVQFHPEKYKKSSKLFFNTWINKCLQ
jgi:GMP synthase-like glutamine amidotransferase